MKAYNNHEIAKILKKNHFRVIRQGKGDHIIYGHDDGRSVTVSKSHPFSAVIWAKLVKMNGIVL